MLSLNLDLLVFKRVEFHQVVCELIFFLQPARNTLYNPLNRCQIKQLGIGLSRNRTFGYFPISEGRNAARIVRKILRLKLKPQ